MKLDNDIIINNRNFISDLLLMTKFVEPMATFGPALFHKKFEESPKKVKTPYGNLALATVNLPGGALLIPKTVSDFLGRFNEDYGLYGCEDSDYGFRMRCANLPQYFYDQKQYFTHEGSWTSSDYTAYGLDKGKSLSNLVLTEDKQLGLFVVNSWLYEFCFRKWNVPSRYEVVKKDGYYLEVAERPDYHFIEEALHRTKQILDHVVKNSEKKLKNTLSSAIATKIKCIWEKCQKNVQL